MDKMKTRIAVVCSHYPGKTGVGTTMWNYARMLSAHGHQVVFITDAAFSPGPEDGLGEMEVLGLKPSLSLRSLYWSVGKRMMGNRIFREVTPDDIDVVKFATAVANSLPKIIRSKRIDTVIFSESFMEYIYCLPIKNCRTIVRFACPRYLFQKIGLSTQPINRYLETKEREAVPKFDCRYSLSRAMADLAADYYCLDRATVAVVHNPVDTELFSALSSPESMRKVGICFVGRFSREKGAEVIIDIIPKLMEENPCLTFSIAGGTGLDAKGNKYIDVLRDKLASGNVLNRFSWRQFVPYHKMPEYYHKNSILVSPTLFESFGMAIVEAQACGLPVVASAVGGVPEVMKDGVTGYLIPAHDAEQFYLKLKQLIDNDRLRTEMGSAAATFVRDNFSFNPSTGNSGK